MPPTVSLAGGRHLMVEPILYLASRSARIERSVCRRWFAIRAERAAIESGASDPQQQPPRLRRAFPTPSLPSPPISADRPYSRSPGGLLSCRRLHHAPQQVLAAVARIDNAYGDRQLCCTCPTWRRCALSE